MPYLAYGIGMKACVSMEIEFGPWNFAPDQAARVRETIANLVDQARISLRPERRSGCYALVEVN